jgi:hypothetical protein
MIILEKDLKAVATAETKAEAVVVIRFKLKLVYYREVYSRLCPVLL